MLDKGIFERLQFNFILISDSSGSVITGKGYNLTDSSDIPIPAGLTALVSSAQPAGTRSNLTAGTMGILMLPESPLLVATRPVYAGNNRTRITGQVVMGRYFDAKEEMRLYNMVAKLPLEFHRYNEKNLPGDFQTAMGHFNDSGKPFVTWEEEEHASFDAPRYFLLLDNNTLGSYSLIKDVYGRPALVIRMDIPRKISEQGQSTTLYFVELLIAAGLIFGLATLLLLEKTVLSRIFNLSHRVNDIGGKKDFSARVETSGDDEIAALATNVNGMLGELEMSQEQLRHRLIKSEENYRLFFHSITDPVIIYQTGEGGAGGTIIEANLAASDVLGYSREELFTLSPANILVTDEGGGLSYMTRQLGSVGSVTLESSYYTKDGRQIPVEIHAHTFDQFGRKAVLAIARDISARRDIERLKMEAFQQIEKNMQQFAILNDHIRNPLQGIIGIADLLQDKYSQKIIRLAKVINDLVQKLDEGYIESEKIHDFLRKYYGVGKK
jgi:PAS domain S-box-containing protein